jgi:transcriptional regulator with XRE-family HTH domain
MAGLTQKQAARKPGVGEKTISLFESGERIDSMKVAQLQRLLRAYDIRQERFFGAAFANEIMLSHGRGERSTRTPL